MTRPNDQWDQPPVPQLPVPNRRGESPDPKRVGLNRTFYPGNEREPRTILNVRRSREGAHMDYRQHQASTWIIDPSLSSSSQHMFSLSQPPLPSANNRAANRPGKKPQTASNRLSAQDFELLIQAPSQSYELLRQYVGADSRYALAAVHAGIYVRSSVRSPDYMGRLEEATVALARIRDFVRFVHSIPKEELKSEQKGCLALRVCYSSLTALLGDFSGDADVPADDPQAPVVSRHDLPGFRYAYPPVAHVLFELSAELGTSINTYKFRRPPCPSVVLKLQAMLKTLEVWNDSLRDTTFTEPTRIIRTWLENHGRVSDARQACGSSDQHSPAISDRRPSPPGQYDTMFPASMEMYGPQLSPGPGHIRNDAVSPNTNLGFLSPPMTYDPFGGSAPTFFPRVRTVGRPSHPGNHFVASDPNYNFDFAGMGMYEHLNGSNYR